jgi:hypothetical protein
MCSINRIAIVSMYDIDGVVDSYLEYFVSQLKEICNYVIVVVNGNINDKGYQKLMPVTDKIIIRDNKGFDFGAYIYVVKLLGVEYFMKYDQIILSNDTNFGPIYPFKDIINDSFEQYDVVSMGMNNYDWLSMLHGYFLIINKFHMSEVLDYICGVDVDNMQKSDVVGYFEYGLTIFLKNKGYHYKSLYNTNNIDLYRSPQKALLEMKFPFVKKRCFEPECYKEDNCIAAIKYINENTSYNIDLILETAYRKYGVYYNLDKVMQRKLVTSDLYFQGINLTEEKILALNNQPLDIYIYGIGNFATFLWEQFHKSVKFVGFVVSDSHYSVSEYKGLKVYRISEIDLTKSKVIVAMSSRSAGEIYNKYENNENVIFLFEKLVI